MIEWPPGQTFSEDYVLRRNTVPFIMSRTKRRNTKTESHSACITKSEASKISLAWTPCTFLGELQSGLNMLGATIEII